VVDDLIKEVMDRAGLTADQARAAAEAVIEFLKRNLPEPAAGIVAEFAGVPDPAQKEQARKKKAAIAGIAATTAAVNVVVLPGAH
jgi:uncharacterized protein (DUF2267 family)